MTGSQADFIVVESFIAPLRVMFGEITEKQEAVYCKHLRQFPKGILESAVDSLEINHKYRRFPALAECMDACQKSSNPVIQPARSNPEAFSWIVKTRRANELHREFLQNFQITGIATQAKLEQWQAPLERYVSAVAWVQAQMIAEVRNMGWNVAALYASEWTDEQTKAFFSDQWQQAKTGMILVPVSQSVQDLCIAEARRFAQYRSGHTGGNLAKHVAV